MEAKFFCKMFVKCKYIALKLVASSFDPIKTNYFFRMLLC